MSCSRVCMLSCVSRVQLFGILWTIAHQTPLSMGFSRQEDWGGLPCPPPGDLLKRWLEPVSPALQADSLPTEPPGMAISTLLQYKVKTKEKNF